MARKQRERRIKGEGSNYQRPSGSWSYTIRLSNGKSRTVTARTMEALGDTVKDLRKELDAGLSDNHKLSTSEWLTYWLDQICVDRVKPRTLHGYRAVRRPLHSTQARTLRARRVAGHAGRAVACDRRGTGCGRRRPVEPARHAARALLVGVLAGMYIALTWATSHTDHTDHPTRKGHHHV